MIALVAGLSGVLAADACTVIVVGKNVSATGRVIVGHNEDDSPPAWTAHSIVPARDWPAGSVVPAEEGRCAKVPQAAHTLATYWAEIKFPWGDGNADAFCNERGVLVVSDSGGRSRERDDDPDALTEGGVGHLVRRCVGERATSARDAVRIIGELVEKYGYSPSARIYTVADKDEAWLVQVVHGRNFCARRCSDDEVTILPNCYSIRRLDAIDAKDLIRSKDLQENARRKGFWDGVSPFDFAAAYQGCFDGRAEWNGLNDSNIGRYRQMIVHFTGEDWPQGKPFPFGVKPAKAKVGAADLKAVLSGHKSPYGNGVKHAEKSWAVCRSWTVESMVCEFAASPADTVLNVAEGPGCEHKYRTFRPFRGEIPADMDRPDPVGRLAAHVRPTVYGDDASVEVRPGGGERPYWNGYSIMFLYPPKFGFKPVKDAVRYRYEILDDVQDKVSFEAATPDAALTPVWPKLRVGYATLTVTGLDARGKSVGVAGTRKFWRKAPFREGAYPKAKCGYGECALKILDYQFARFAKPKPAGVNYPTKQYAMAARGMAHYAGLVKDEAKRAEAIRAAKMYADAMIALAEPEGASLAHFPPTYFKTSKSAGQDGATTMLIYPADAALAYLDVYEVTKETKYLQEAEAVAATYMRLQGEDGSWPLKVTIADAKPLKDNRTLTTRHVALFEKLFRLTGKDAYRAAGDRAFGYVERGPLTTWQWEGQFEDTPPSANYTNLTKHDACSTAIYIVDRYPGDKARLVQARELLRFAEDQFVNWEKPYFPGRAPKSASGFGHFWSQDHWVTPCVFEQYGCYTPVDASAAKLILTYLALYRAEGDATDLAKARALGDTMTRMTDDDGLESTWWSTDQLRQDVWPNCMFASAFALEELAGTDSRP